jgi:hypothetical protein
MGGDSAGCAGQSVVHTLDQTSEVFETSEVYSVDLIVMLQLETSYTSPAD